MDNIYLIGMMGSGKSTTAVELAKFLKLKAVDIDDLIVKNAKKSISQIFKEDGEPVFRKLEGEWLRKVCKEKGQVVATGGGVILSPKNIQHMRDSGTIVYLRASFPVLWNRVKHNQDRPLLKGSSPEEALKEIFEERSSLYENAAHHVFLTDQKTPKQVAKEIFEGLFNKK